MKTTTSMILISFLALAGVLVLASASDAGEGPASLRQLGEVCDLNVALTVTPDVVVTVNPSCETTGRLGTLTFRYTGGGCAASDNAAMNCGDKASTCEGSIDDAFDVTIFASGKKAEYTIDPAGRVAQGGIITISAIKFDAWTTITLTNGAGSREFNRIHTSCSAPLVVGDVFGSITLTGINGQEAESTIIYTVTNSGDVYLGDVTLDGSPFDHHRYVGFLLAGESQTYTFIERITEPTSFSVGVVGGTADGKDCSASDSKDIELPPINTRMPSRKSKKGRK